MTHTRRRRQKKRKNCGGKSKNQFNILALFLFQLDYSVSVEIISFTFIGPLESKYRNVSLAKCLHIGSLLLAFYFFFSFRFFSFFVFVCPSHLLIIQYRLQSHRPKSVCDKFTHSSTDFCVLSMLRFNVYHHSRRRRRRRHKYSTAIYDLKSEAKIIVQNCTPFTHTNRLVSTDMFTNDFSHHDTVLSSHKIYIQVRIVNLHILLPFTVRCALLFFNTMTINFRQVNGLSFFFSFILKLPIFRRLAALHM